MDKINKSTSIKSQDLPESLSLPSPRELPSLSLSLPSAPGVYWFLGNNNQVLYVGKSVNLRSRLLSYSRVGKLAPRTKHLVESTQNTKYLQTPSEIEALLLEAELIRLYQPEFNIRLKDSKSSLYLCLTKDQYPIIFLKRKPDLTFSNKNTVFGPFQSSYQIKSLLKMIRPIFLWCDHPLSGKACFYYHIELCSGACLSQISPKDYQESIHQLILFFKGKQSKLLSQFKHQILEASNRKDFEMANQIKNKYQLMQDFSKNYKIRQKYTVLPNLPQDEITHRLIHAKKILIKYLNLPNDFQLNRIECYDISHFQEDFSVGSMVVVTKGQKNTAEYRCFKIKSKTSLGDSGKMAEVISRRANHNDWDAPNLIIVDGSKPQINAARASIPWTIPVIGLAKKPDRLVFLQPTKDGLRYRYHRLKPNDPSTKLFVEIRNESHRFANQYQKKLHHISLFD